MLNNICIIYLLTFYLFNGQIETYTQYIIPVLKNNYRHYTENKEIIFVYVFFYTYMCIKYKNCYYFKLYLLNDDLRFRIVRLVEYLNYDTL